MKSEPILLHHIQPTADDVCLSRLIEFFGLDCKAVDTSAFDAELNRAADYDLCVLANAATLDRWLQKAVDQTSALDCLRQKASCLFVYGFTPETPQDVAAGLSDGAIKGVRRFTRTDLRYAVSSSQPETTREFSDLSFGCVRNATDFGFVCSENARGTTPLVTIEGMPFWVLVRKNRCKAFLLACSAIADIEEPVNNIDASGYFSRLLPAAYFSRLMPAAMFLRSAFRNRCRLSKNRFGNFIIDDPPLKRSYGYLNYRNLVSKMDTFDFASTIAFIPWNYKRTDNEVTQLFRERPDRLSLCVHGCDHTTGEFSSTDPAVLNSKVQLASARMNSLRRKDGLSYSKTMVFPQGQFSAQALTALKSNNYLAAVNSSSSPAWPGANGSLAIADFLEPAITRYGGVPIFLRRYPGKLEQFAFDLFFGKPLLIVEHHEYFKDDGAHLAEFISRLNSFEKLQWGGLHEIMTKSYLEHEIADDIIACRLYANHHTIENQAEHDRTFIVTKFEPGDVPIENVLVNGRTTNFTLSGNMLEFAMRIPALSSTMVNIVYRNVLPYADPRQGFANRSLVWTRRMLSEFRDNVLCRSELLLAGARSLHRGLLSRNTIDPPRQNDVSPNNAER